MSAPAISIFDCYVNDEVVVRFVTRDPDRRAVAPTGVEVLFGLAEGTRSARVEVTVDRTTGVAEFSVTPTSSGTWAYVIRVTEPVATTGEGRIRAKAPEDFV